MTRLIPSEDELHAYVDDRLPRRGAAKCRRGWRPTRTNRRGSRLGAAMPGVCGRPWRDSPTWQARLGWILSICGNGCTNADGGSGRRRRRCCWRWEWVGSEAGRRARQPCLQACSPWRMRSRPIAYSLAVRHWTCRPPTLRGSRTGYGATSIRSGSCLTLPAMVSSRWALGCSATRRAQRPCWSFRIDKGAHQSIPALAKRTLCTHAEWAANRRWAASPLLVPWCLQLRPGQRGGRCAWGAGPAGFGVSL